MNKHEIFTNELCVGCNRCIENCPCDEANIAVLEDGSSKIYIDKDKCIGCGECIRSCTHNARDYVDDTQRFFQDLRSGKNISLIVAPAIRTNFEQYEKLLGYLHNLGVSYIFDTSFGADICTWAYISYITKNGKTGLISQPCPVIVNYIERYTPENLPRLAPIHSPAMCMAIHMKKYKKIPGSYAFLSPCIAKQDEFADKNTGQIVSYNITFKKIAQYLEYNNIDYRAFPKYDFDNDQHGLGALYPTPGGLKINVQQRVDDVWIHQVEGQPHSCHFLDKYFQTPQNSTPFLVDILNCQHGCNVGTGAIKDESQSLDVDRQLFVAQTQAKETAKRNKAPGPSFKSLDKTLNLNDFVRTYENEKSDVNHITPFFIVDGTTSVT